MTLPDQSPREDWGRVGYPEGEEKKEDSIVCCICYEPLDDDAGIEYGSDISRSVSPVFDFHGSSKESSEEETRDLEKGEMKRNRFAQHKSHSGCAKGYVRFHQKAVSHSNDLEIVFDDLEALASRISCPVCRKAVDFEYAQGKGLVRMSTFSAIGSRVKIAFLVFLLLVSYILVYQISCDHGNMAAATAAGNQMKSATKFAEIMGSI